MTRLGAVGTVGQPERATQDRVIALFRDERRYRDLGDGADRLGNSHMGHVAQSTMVKTSRWPDSTSGATCW